MKYNLYEYIYEYLYVLTTEGGSTYKKILCISVSKTPDQTNCKRYLYDILIFLYSVYSWLAGLWAYYPG